MTNERPNRGRLQTAFLTGLVGAGLTALALGVFGNAEGADHIDSPTTVGDQAADIADLFAFERGGNLVLAMTLSEIQTAPDLLLGESLFDPRVLYEFKIDDVRDGNAEADWVVQAFALGNSRNQQMRIIGPVPPDAAGTESRLVNGPSLKVKVSTGSEAIVAERDGVRAFAGVRDDPFFFDFVKFSEILAIRQAGGTDGLAFRSPDDAVDTFAGLNTYAIVVEIPTSQLGGVDIADLRVWATTSR